MQYSYKIRVIGNGHHPVVLDHHFVDADNQDTAEAKVSQIAQEFSDDPEYCHTGDTIVWDVWREQ